MKRISVYLLIIVLGNLVEFSAGEWSISHINIVLNILSQNK